MPSFFIYFDFHIWPRLRNAYLAHSAFAFFFSSVPWVGERKDMYCGIYVFMQNSPHPGDHRSTRLLYEYLYVCVFELHFCICMCILVFVHENKRNLCSMQNPPHLEDHRSPRSLGPQTWNPQEELFPWNWEVVFQITDANRSRDRTP